MKYSLQEIDDIYGRLRELGKELGLPVIEPFISAQYISSNGHKEQLFNEHCRTLVRNHYTRMLRDMLNVYDTSGTYGAGVLRVQDITNTTRDYIDYAYYYPSTTKGYSGAANIDNRGIVIGRGSDAESFESYALSNQIMDGSAANEMLYSATTFNYGYNAGGGYIYATRDRTFTNSSGGSITVTESGLYYFDNNSRTFMTMRDLDAWSGGQAVADSESIQVTYDLRVYY